MLALFFAIHSITLAASAWGMAAFARVATAVGPSRAGALGVLALLLLLIDRVDHVREARRMHEGTEHAHRGFAHNVTGWITLAWLGGQAWSGVYAIGSHAVPAEYLYSLLVAQLSSTGMFGVPWVALSQVLALIAVSFFLLSRACDAVAPRTRMALAVGGLAALLFPLNGLLYLATGSRVFGPSHLTMDVPAGPCGSAR